MVSKEETFTEILGITDKFVKHPSTPEQVLEAKRSITERLKKINTGLRKKLKTGIGIISLFLVLSFGFQGCQKYDEPNPQRITQASAEQLITQTFTLQTVTTQEQQIAKQFDPATWVYVYSDVAYTLTIQSALNTYTKVVSVQDMLAGGVSLSMIAGTYNVTYTPVGLPKVDTKLSVFIAMTNVVVTGTPIVLQGQLASSLVIVDIPAVTGVMCPNGVHSFTHDARGFYYGYIHTPLNDPNMSTLLLSEPAIDDIQWHLDNTTTPPFALGKVFWLQSNLGITVQLNIPAMVVTQVIIP